MGRSLIMDLAVINIVIKNHSEEKYIKFLETAFNYKYPVHIFGHYNGLPASIEVKLDEGCIVGKFFRFTDINEHQAWLDTNKGSEIRDEHGNPIPQIENNLKPNSKAIYFVFIIKNHRLVFDTGNIAISSMYNFLKNLFQDVKVDGILKEDINLTIEQSQETIAQIKKIYSINQIDIDINRPNPDDIRSLEGIFKARLENMHADSMHEEFRSKDGGIKPDKELEQLMRIATSNGKVVARGYDSTGKRIQESTESHPLKERKLYNTDDTTYLSALKVFAFDIVGKIMESMA